MSFFDLDLPVQSPLVSTSGDLGNQLAGLDIENVAEVRPIRRLRTPAEQAKRDKGNLASRVCRFRKKQRYAELERRVAELLDENQRLRKRRCKRCGSLVVA